MSFSEEILRTYLSKLSKEDMIEIFIKTVRTVLDNDEKRLADYVHSTVTFLQASEVVNGRMKLWELKEPHRTEVLNMIHQISKDSPSRT